MNNIKLILGVIAFFAGGISSVAQIRYFSDGKIAINSEPFGSYGITAGDCAGLYIKCKNENFFQIDCTPAATRLAGHSDEIVFFNTQTGNFNSIQVKNIYNYVDIKAKTNLKPLEGMMSQLQKLTPYSYSSNESISANNQKNLVSKDSKKFALLAQEVEQYFPDLVVTDNEGNKLINYTELIPVMLSAMKEMSLKINALEEKIK